MSKGKPRSVKKTCQWQVFSVGSACLQAEYKEEQFFDLTLGGSTKTLIPSASDAPK